MPIGSVLSLIRFYYGMILVTIRVALNRFATKENFLIYLKTRWETSSKIYFAIFWEDDLAGTKLEINVFRVRLVQNYRFATVNLCYSLGIIWYRGCVLLNLNSWKNLDPAPPLNRNGLSKIQSSKVFKVMWSAEASNMLLEAYYDRNPKLVNLMKKVKGAFVQTKRRIDSNRNGNRYILSRLEVKITVYLPIWVKLALWW